MSLMWCHGDSPELPSPFGVPPSIESACIAGTSRMLPLNARIYMPTSTGTIRQMVMLDFV